MKRENTTAALVVGGLHWERCLSPGWTGLYGSGGRAACVLAGLGHTVHLHTATDPNAEKRFKAHADAYGNISCFFKPTERASHFTYTHPLAIPAVGLPKTGVRKPHIEAKGHAVLCFGMLDAEIAIDGSKVVFDPQSPESPASFRTIGVAEELVLVLNELEAFHLSGEEIGTKAAEQIAMKEDASAVVIKRGPRGCLVWTPEEVSEHPCYRAGSIFKIGSGDVFSSVFLREWALAETSVHAAAAAAARATCIYCESREVLSLQPNSYLESARTWEPAEVLDGHGGVYLAGPFFTTAQRWLVAEVHRVLEEFRLPVFSPFHDVGGGTPELVAREDLAGLRESSVVLAMVQGGDVGTVFEVGYAVSRGLRVVILAENMSPNSLTMLEGSGCEVTSDLAAALYACCWKQ